MSGETELTIYEYSKCTTCRKAMKDLEGAGRKVKRIPIFDAPPSKEELRSIVQRSRLELKKFFNTSGEVYKELGLKDKLSGMSHEEQLELLASNGRLLKRPIVTDGDKVTVGYKPEQFETEWHN